MAEREQAQDLALAVGQRIRLGRGLLRRLGGDEPGAERRMDVAAAARHLADRRDDLLVRGLLEDVAARAGPERLADVAGIVLHRQDEHLRVGRLLLELREYVDTALAGHHHVEEDHVGLQRAGPEDGVLRVPSLPHHLDVVLVLEQEPQPGPDDRVVVHDDDGDQSGTSTASVVPPPGLDSRASFPSWSATRSRMPTRPRPPERVSSTSNPLPSSSITSEAVPLRRMRRTLTFVAPACFTTFVSASCTIR